MDRCALFVDAGYMLTVGATAVHGTSSRDSVSWDYAGLLRFLASLSADRTGQQLLRCYWYEATADGRRTPEHDTLADLPGLTLRLSRTRPDQHGGVEIDIHHDLTALARNRAISDVLLVSAEEGLAQVIADVQDVGIRVMIVHIRVDGNWTVSRSLRQQCDDVVQIDRTQLQPYAELIVGAEPAGYDKPYTVAAYGGGQPGNGHAASAGGSGHPGLPSGSAGSHSSPSAIYTAPIVTEYLTPPRPTAGPPPESSPSAPVAGSGSVAGAGSSEPGARGMHRSRVMGDSPSPPAPQPLPGPPLSGPPLSGPPLSGPPQYADRDLGSFRDPAAPALPGPPAAPPAPDLLATQHGAPPSAPAQAHPRPPAGSLPPDRGAGRAAAGPWVVTAPTAPGRRAAGLHPPYAPSVPDSLTDSTAARGASAPPEPLTGGPPRLPVRHGDAANRPYADSRHADSPDGGGRHADSLSWDGRHENGLPVPQAPQPRPGPGGLQPARPAGAGTEHIPRQGSYDARLPVASTAGRALASGSLADTAAMAHAEGFEFGKSVAHDAPALWLEAVLARKPRMPSDLEARLLEGSALPVEALLHDEVRQALRRGFWDALERSRR